MTGPPVVIGEATLWLADSREVVPRLGEVDSLITDPPYGMEFRSNRCSRRHEAITNDSDDEAIRFSCVIPVKYSRYIFCRWDNVASIPKPRSLITWVKNTWSMGDLEHEHARQTETIAFYPGPDHYFPTRRPQDVIRAPRTGNDNHPTEKPVGLMMAIAEWTSGTVVDPFMGSGSTGVACARLRRRFIGIEINDVHFRTACRRIEAAYCQPDMFFQEAAE